ncbi:MAG: hypothetical protein M1835_002004 [Candelina submexicana]|nr:MAG: hypothetical protein M1835_002004 [Candelina submexicana]
MANHDEERKDPTRSPNAEQQQTSNDNSTIKLQHGRPECFGSTIQELLFVLTATMAIAAISFLLGNILVISSFIGRDLQMTSAEITWINASSSLAAGSFLLFFGGVADMFGRKPLLISSLFLFSVFALGCGFATTPLYMDIFNGLMGLCSAAAVPPAVGILGAVYEKPSKRKNYAFACFSAGNPLGFAFGSISSGISTKIFGWRASFWWLAIIYVVFTIIAFFTVPEKQQGKERISLAAVKKFDVIGALLVIAGIALFSSSLR